MVEAGVIGPDEPLELLEGRLVLVSPQGPPHASLVGALAEKLRAAYGAGHAVREEKPLELPDSLPGPDVAVVHGAQLDYAARHPNAGDALLVVEVAVTSQALDHEKARIYARAGVPVLGSSMFRPDASRYTPIRKRTGATGSCAGKCANCSDNTRGDGWREAPSYRPDRRRGRLTRSERALTQRSGRPP
jgi:Putative restriction endonuclease